ncbi:MAG: hypothetical protein JSU70_12245 [Phycisphaerales bacterium]|nr:MAG: hypothetical protein JSU70_12245 [Phycisphaerales bacterium]
MKTCILILSILALAAPTQAKYGGGTGEPNDPYLIYTPEQLNAIGAEPNDWDKHFALVADIDLSAYTGTEFNIIGYYRAWNDRKGFAGVFDGNGHTISDFGRACTGGNHIGLFGYVSGEHAQIKNVRLTNPNIDAEMGERVAALVGWLDSGTVRGCSVEAGSVLGYGPVGGLVGYANGEIVDCSSNADVSGFQNVGGLVGWASEDTKVARSYSNGAVSGDSLVGGLIGQNDGTLIHCYSESGVTGIDLVGGLVGENLSDGAVADSYSTGGVTGTTEVSGLVGKNSGAVVSSFWDVETSGQATSARGIGKTTRQMYDPNTFSNWGCSGIWTIDAGRDYLRLAWEHAPGEVLTNPVFWHGKGEPNDPYVIHTAEQLNQIGLVVCAWDKHFKLMADIDLSVLGPTEFNRIGVTPRLSFGGSFSGNGHAISNLVYDCNGLDYIGLFGSVSGTVRNLTLIDPNVEAGTGRDIGSLVGILLGTVSNCHVEGGSVSGGTSVGGLIGSGGTIENCTSSVNVFGDRAVGGLVGSADFVSDSISSSNVVGNESVGGLAGKGKPGSVIVRCGSSGNVVGVDSVGGLTGTSDTRYVNSTVSESYSVANVSGQRSVGGLVGVNDCSRRGPNSVIRNCYAGGSVEGIDEIGGLVGADSGEILFSYSACSVLGTGEHIGGFVGGEAGGGDGCERHTVGCFWDVEASGLSHSDGGAGKTTAEMRMRNTFTDAGWDFIEVWDIADNQTYPFLRSRPQGDLNYDGRVDFLDLAILGEQWLGGSEWPAR